MFTVVTGLGTTISLLKARKGNYKVLILKVNCTERALLVDRLLSNTESEMG